MNLLSVTERGCGHPRWTAGASWGILAFMADAERTKWTRMSPEERDELARRAAEHAGQPLWAAGSKRMAAKPVAEAEVLDTEG